MAAENMHVLIIGGGIGGLCLAQGLKKAGIRFTVFERDQTALSREQGYRIHVDPNGSSALHECLPDALWDAFFATAGDPGADFGFLTEGLHKLLLVEDGTIAHGAEHSTRGHHAVSRLTLRQILLAGLEEHVQFNKEFVSYEQLSQGEIAVYFADGSSARGSVLVGVDGANSKVRRQFLPHAKRDETGAMGIGGKLELNEHTRAWLPKRIQSGMNVTLGPRHFLFTAVYNRRRKPEEAISLLGEKIALANLDPELLFHSLENRDYILWAFVTRKESELLQASGDVLQERVGRSISGWHPLLKQLIRDTDASTINAFPFLVSSRVEHWPTTNITLMGDAIHSMTPVGGMGANTALRDARLLSRKLIAAHEGRQSLTEALRDYETAMLDYGFAAVQDSLRNTKQALATGGARIVGKAFLKLCGAVPPLKRALFKDRWADHETRLN